MSSDIRVLETGVPVEVERRGRIIKIVPEKPIAKLDRLVRRPRFFKFDPDAIVRVAETLHRKGVERLLREDRRRLSLVDCVSLEFIRARGLRDVLALDAHFAEAGCRLSPPARKQRDAPADRPAQPVPKVRRAGST
jgi:hypothetical protein